jgi:glycine cleavage system aminomethyltransferase T
VGYATSGCWSPILKKPWRSRTSSAALRAGDQVEMEVTVEHQRMRADAVVRALPFYDPERKKA